MRRQRCATRVAEAPTDFQAFATPRRGGRRYPGGAAGAIMALAMTPLPAPIEALFARCPALYGFSVRSDSASELFVADVGIAPELSTEHHNEIFDQIVVALAELIADEPAADEVLRGRTFARVLH